MWGRAFGRLVARYRDSTWAGDQHIKNTCVMGNHGDGTDVSQSKTSVRKSEALYQLKGVDGIASRNSI